MLERMECQEVLDLQDHREPLVKEDTQAPRDLLDPRCNIINPYKMTIDVTKGVIGSPI